ncbi:glycoside hydrolase family 76 protein [Tessaracoccus antarcticus]|uniref:Glycosyl hydrolase n=1 Tax=Tessaracoccus antarcticus TaxID=2479848 RepID=A0A3M0GXB8_9ACTN|nr:glycoside hydrolase family 76 protein [Tessaracoccus antarcticus]RMB62016.1 glycosyl hydrolase [Tessaracoccus antarcticus]
MVLLSGHPVAGTGPDLRAATAESLVLGGFVGRFLHLPGTLMGRTVASIPDVVAQRRVVVTRGTPFHYWWQAHLLDAIVDGGLRRVGVGDASGARRSARLARRLLWTIILRNRGTLRNDFFDDMGWLALALQRLDILQRHLGAGRPDVLVRRAHRTLTRELRSGVDGGGGVFWNKERDFLNAAAAGPAALYLARSGRVAEARVVVDWLHRHLLDDRGLIIDGLRSDGTLAVEVYTYNQGPALGALLELGEPGDLERATSLVRTAQEHLTQRVGPRQVLITHGTGDGGLFTGILVRHLALAARHHGLSDDVRGIAAGLVRSTSDALWEGRDAATGLFPTSTARPARGNHNPSARVELATQLQAWIVMEAAARLDH